MATPGTNPALRWLLILLLLLLILFLLFKYCYQPGTGKKDEDCVVFDVSIGSTGDTVRTAFPCDEIILNRSEYSPAEVDTIHRRLTDRGFVKIDSCACTEQLELWKYQGSEEPGSIDLIGVIKETKQDQTPVGGDGLSVNYDLEFPDPKLFISAPFNGDQQTGTPVSIFIPNPPGGAPSTTVRIGVVDSGVDTTMDFFRNKEYVVSRPIGCTALNVNSYGLNATDLQLFQPIDSQGHGTHINGIIAGVPNATLHVDTSTTKLELLNVKITRGALASGTLFDALCGLYYALDHDARIINVSWGYRSDTIPTIFDDFLQRARSANVVIVAGLGNNGLTLGPGQGFWPASLAAQHDNVIAVASADATGGFSSFSNRGDSSIVTVLVRGENIPSTFPTYVQAQLGQAQTSMAVISGTSMAAAVVSRVVALLYAKKPWTQPHELKDRLRNQTYKNGPTAEILPAQAVFNTW
jgi:subtilisin family serine protease